MADTHRPQSTAAWPGVPRLGSEHYWRRKNAYYYRYLERLHAGWVPAGGRVLDLRCGTGDLLAAVRPRLGVGVDVDAEALALARQTHRGYQFVLASSRDELPVAGAYDAILLPNVIGELADIQRTFDCLHAHLAPAGQLIVTYYNFVWEPVLKVGSRLGLNRPRGEQNWLGMRDVQNLLFLADYQVETSGVELLLPKQVPVLSPWVNERLAPRPPFRWLGLLQYFIARPFVPPARRKELSCTVVVPCRNEVGNVAPCVERVPRMGTHTELIFVDGASTDGTVEEIERQIALHRGERDIKLIHQTPRAEVESAQRPDGKVTMLKLGKGDAVRKGFAAASGEVLMILDADLTAPPEDLPKFFDALASGKGGLVNGSRLVYPLEDQAMRFVNMAGNKFFSLAFSWLLGQYLKDTLCGTKALQRDDYERLCAVRAEFGEFDPFGDFELLFGAARLGLRIVEVPVRYRRRASGHTKVRVLDHGWLLLRMAWRGFVLFKVRRSL